MSGDTERTDIIPGLRLDDTPPLGVPLPAPGRHRARRGGPRSRRALVAVFGAPAAGVAFAVGLLAPGWFSDGEPGSVTVSPSAGALPTAELPPLPTPSRADRSRPRETPRPALAPPTSRTPRTSGPSPTPRTTTPRPSPTGSGGPSTRSLAPTTEAPGTGLPVLVSPSPEEAEDD